MTDPITIEFSNLKTNLNTYNNILKSSISLQKEVIIIQYLINFRMIYEQPGKPSMKY